MVDERNNGKAVVAVAGVTAVVVGIILLNNKSTTTQATLSGTVMSGEIGGGVIAGAKVNIAGKLATTGTTGKFTMTGLKIGEVTATITATGFITYTTPVTLKAGLNTKTFLLFKTVTTAGLSGKVTNINNGAAVSGVTVTVASKSAITDFNGNYSITGLSAGTFNYMFDKPFYRTKTGTVVLVAGANTLDMTMNNLGTANIHVQDIYDYTPIAGATVVVTSFPTKITDTNGIVNLTNVPAGNYSGTTTKTGYNTIDFSFTIQPEMTVDVNVQLTKQNVTTGKVSGSVIDPAGNGISGASVNVGGYVTTTSILGGYSIDVPPGTYTATASKTGYQSSSKTITVHTGDAIIADFTLASTLVNGVAQGFVTDSSNGQGVEGVLVWIPKPGGGSWSTTTGNTGYYAIQLPPGTYNVTAEKTGYSEQVKSVTIYSNQTSTLNFALQPSTVNLGFRLRVSASFLANEFPGVPIEWSAAIGDAISESFHCYFIPADSTCDKTGYDLNDPSIINWPGWLNYYIYDSSTLTELLHWTIQPITLQNGHLYEINGAYLNDMGTY